MIRTIPLALLWSFLACSVGLAENWVEPMFKIKKHDFGSVVRGAKAEYEFVINNIYMSDVHIAGVRSSCRCTQVRIKQPWLKTYEQGAIVATIDTKAFYGHKPATITVTFDQPRHAQIRLSTDAHIRADVTLKPGVAALGTIKEGTPATQEITVTRHGRSDWQVLEIRSTNPHIVGQVVRTNRQRGQTDYELSVHLDENAPIGYIRDHLFLLTNDQGKEIPVPVEAVVQGPIVVNPTSLFMGVVQPGQRVTKQFVVRGTKPFRITSVLYDEACFEIEVSAEQEPKTLHLIPVTFIASELPGRVQKKIRIETDLSSDSPELAAFAVVSSH